MKAHYPHTLGLYLISSLASASADDALEDDLFFDIPIVLSASNLEQPVTETPVAVTSIDRQMIEASGARNIPDILRMAPGIQVGYSLNAFGDEPRYVVTYHGHADQYSRQLQVLIDGRSIYEPLLGGVNWNTVPVNVDDIERIEVIRGPNASSFGSNSFLAVINIITREATEDQGHYIRTNAGEHSIGDLTYRFADSVGVTDYRVTLTTYNDDGVDAPDSTDRRDDIGTNAIDYRFDFHLDDLNKFTYQGGYSDSTQQARGSTEPGNYASDRDITNISAYQFFRLDNTIDDKHQVKTQYYYNRFDKTDVYTSDSLPGFLIPLTLPGPLTDGIKQQLNITSSAIGNATVPSFTLDGNRSFLSERHNLEVLHYYTIDEAYRLVWGGGYQHDSGKSAYYFNQGSKVSRDIKRLFGNLEGRLTEHVNLNLGVLWEDSDSVGSNISPRASIIGKIDDQNWIRVSYSEAIRTLFLAEQFSDLRLTATVPVTADITSPSPSTVTGPVNFVSDVLKGNNRLQAEQIRARDIGYYRRSHEYDMTISARAFYNSITNLIDTKAEISNDENFVLPGDTPLVSRFDNMYSTNVKGVELELDMMAGEHTRIIANAMLLDIEGLFDIADANPPLIDQDDLVERAREYHHSAPDKAFNFMLIRDFEDSPYTASIKLNYVGDMAWLDANRTPNYLGERNTGGYRKLDVRLARNWDTNNYDITLALNLQNILENYNAYDDEPKDDPPGLAALTKYERDSTAYLELRIRHQ